MDKKANDTFAFDLENRLDDFFSDSLPSDDESTADDSQGAGAGHPLKELKSTILAIDWEITDEALEAFIEQVEGLVSRYEDDKVVHTLLKLLKSLGKYILSHKSKAHPDTIKRLMAVYHALEESVTNDGLQSDKREEMVLEEVRQFLRLKTQIIDSRAPSATPAPAAAPPHQTTAAPAPQPDVATLIKAVQDLKSMVTNELASIRKEIATLKK